MTRPAVGFTGGESWEELTETLRACIQRLHEFDSTRAVELDAVVYERERRLTQAVKHTAKALIVLAAPRRGL